MNIYLIHLNANVITDDQETASMVTPKYSKKKNPKFYYEVTNWMISYRAIYRVIQTKWENLSEVVVNTLQERHQ